MQLYSHQEFATSDIYISKQVQGVSRPLAGIDEIEIKATCEALVEKLNSPLEPKHAGENYTVKKRHVFSQNIFYCKVIYLIFIDFVFYCNFVCIIAGDTGSRYPRPLCTYLFGNNKAQRRSDVY